MNKKTVFVEKKAREELEKFSRDVQDEFAKRFEILEQRGRLDFPEARKVAKGLFEIRIKFQGEYRGFYAYVSAGFVLVLYFFKKKTQKTPLKDIETALRRLRHYEDR